MNVTCILDENKYPYEIKPKKLTVESQKASFSSVWLTIGETSIEVNADELIKAVQNCKNS